MIGAAAGAAETKPVVAIARRRVPGSTRKGERGDPTPCVGCHPWVRQLPIKHLQPGFVDGEQDLPEALRRVQALVRCGGLREREDAVDDRAPRGPGAVFEERIELSRAPTRRALDPEVAEEEAGDVQDETSGAAESL